MKLAIFSDSHDNIPNLKKALIYCQNENIGVILHCGDLCKIESLIESWPKSSGIKMHLAVGNADILKKSDYESFFPLKIHGPVGEFTFENKKIAFTHFPDKAKELAKQQKHDYIFYGHTHKPWEETVEKTKLVNPGEIGGMPYQSTFAVLDLEKNKLSLKILGEI